MGRTERTDAPLAGPEQFTLAVAILSGATGIIALFMPVAFDLSPVGMIRRGFETWAGPPQGIVTEALSESWRLAPSFLLPVVALVGSIRGRSAGRLRTWELRGGFGLGTAATFASLSLYAPPVHWRGMWPLVIWPLTAILAFLGVGVWVSLRGPRYGIPPWVSMVVFLETVFTGTVLATLIDLAGHWQVGAKCLLIAALLYAVHIFGVIVSTAVKYRPS
jgi:hypothetical protein